MLYPNTQPSGVMGGAQDNKRRLQQLLSHGRGVMPLFGGVSGRSASAESLPSAGMPSLSFNPFLKMLAGHPGETLDNISASDPLSGFTGSSVPTSSNPTQSGGAQPANGPGGFTPAPNGGYVPAQQANPFDAGGSAAGNTSGHFNGQNIPGSPGPVDSGVQPGLTDAMGMSGLGAAPGGSLYHTLLQLAMYGLDN